MRFSVITAICIQVSWGQSKLVTVRSITAKLKKSALTKLSKKRVKALYLSTKEMDWALIQYKDVILPV